jgi:hypothetical protein
MVDEVWVVTAAVTDDEEKDDDAVAAAGITIRVAKALYQ